MEHSSSSISMEQQQSRQQSTESADVRGQNKTALQGPLLTIKDCTSLLLTSCSDRPITNKTMAKCDNSHDLHDVAESSPRGPHLDLFRTSRSCRDLGDKAMTLQAASTTRLLSSSALFDTSPTRLMRLDMSKRKHRVHRRSCQYVTNASLDDEGAHFSFRRSGSMRKEPSMDLAPRQPSRRSVLSTTEENTFSRKSSTTDIAPTRPTRKLSKDGAELLTPDLFDTTTCIRQLEERRKIPDCRQHKQNTVQQRSYSHSKLPSFHPLKNIQKCTDNGSTSLVDVMCMPSQNRGGFFTTASKANTPKTRGVIENQSVSFHNNRLESASSISMSSTSSFFNDSSSEEMELFVLSHFHQPPKQKLDLNDILKDFDNYLLDGINDKDFGLQQPPPKTNSKELDYNLLQPQKSFCMDNKSTDGSGRCPSFRVVRRSSMTSKAA